MGSLSDGTAEKPSGGLWGTAGIRKSGKLTRSLNWLESRPSASGWVRKGLAWQEVEPQRELPLEAGKEEGKDPPSLPLVNFPPGPPTERLWLEASWPQDSIFICWAQEAWERDLQGSSAETSEPRNLQHNAGQSHTRMLNNMAGDHWIPLMNLFFA